MAEGNIMADYLVDTPLQVIKRPDPAGLAGDESDYRRNLHLREDDSPSVRPTLPFSPILQRR